MHQSESDIGETVNGVWERFKEAYNRLFCSAAGTCNVMGGMALAQYFDSMMHAISEAVRMMPPQNVGPYLTSMATHLSNFIGGEMYVGVKYDNTARMFAMQMREIMGVKDASFNGEASQISLVAHSEYVSAYARRLAKEVGLNDSEADEIRVAGLVHDIGKLGIADLIIAKEGPLTEQEMEKVKPHPVYGADIARNAGLKNIAEIVLLHHRWFDGRGYPENLGWSIERKNIRYGILVAADAFDVISRGRPYRKSVGPRGAMEELARNSGRQFHPKIVETALITSCLVDEYNSRNKAA